MSDINVLNELKKISKILLLTNAPLVEKEIEKIANSDARKKMWVLIDGNRTPKQIAEQIGVTASAVRYFLRDAKAAEFIEYGESDAPRRILDYVPPVWIELLAGGEPTELEQKESTGPKLEQFQKSSEEKGNA